MNAKPAIPAAALFEGKTVHCRYTPYRRRFEFAFAQVLLDVDRIQDAARGLRLFSYNRPNVMSFYDRDHGDRSGAPLRAWAQAQFTKNGVSLDGGAIRLLCFPRMFGFVFNPISVFFGYGPDGALRGLIYQVNNTFGETHSYVAHVEDGIAAPHSAAKAFHVSPFFAVEGDYTFRLKPPCDTLLLTIENRVQGQRTHFATIASKQKLMSDARLAKICLTMPLMTLAVVAGIHWHALFIWMRGARYHPKPAAPATETTLAHLPVRPLSH